MAEYCCIASVAVPCMTLSALSVWKYPTYSLRVRFSTANQNAGHFLRLMYFAQSVLNRLWLLRLACRYSPASHSLNWIENG